MPNQRARPTLRRRRLGEQLEQTRDRIGLSQEAAAALMGWAKEKLSKIENARAHISPKDVSTLLNHYEVEDEAFTSALCALAKDAGRRGWWAGFGEVEDAYKDLLSVESDADEVRFYSPNLIPGLLQTGGYARQIIGATALTRSDDEKEARVTLRLARQGLLTKSPSPLRMWVVIDEAALRQKAPDGIMRDQLMRLLDDSNRPTITIQIMPTGCAAHPGQAGMFSLVGFPTPWPTVVLLENIRGGAFLEGTSDVAIFEDAFNQIVATALSPDESREIIRKIAKEIHQ